MKIPVADSVDAAVRVANASSAFSMCSADGSGDMRDTPPLCVEASPVAQGEGAGRGRLPTCVHYTRIAVVRKQCSDYVNTWRCAPSACLPYLGVIAYCPHVWPLPKTFGQTAHC